MTDELWARLEPLIPVHPLRFKHPGRRRADDREAVEGILWVSGATCWRRLDEWRAAGVWDQLREQLLGELRAAGKLDLSAAIVDSSHLRALKGGTRWGPVRSTAAATGPSTT